MLARFAARREGRLALALVAAFSLTGCGFSKMQDILTDKPANGQQQKPQPSSSKPGAAWQPTAATPQPDPLPLPPAQ